MVFGQHTSTPQEFHIHKDVLCFWSDYYRTAAGAFTSEPSSITSSLPNESAYIFGVFEIFCYTNELTDKHGISRINLGFDTLCALWIFGSSVAERSDDEYTGEKRY
ncbi:hypothetical protein E4T38_00818 [Aureobasidium subglaciale]|nr:hypothetical protein E4T38_00818 [Aureobasidium subglaciale]KAI5231124.1 hypothetical protein E4T40_00819 [Aureobasidium subglaciale]KAI5234206.1 hypothetical protein E4T41_00817 [Aureobasidium subglaciale]KAI5267622.1 hypothetical protein E4T46_00817 [Aureobasidium subglaciale]